MTIVDLMKLSDGLRHRPTGCPLRRAIHLSEGIAPGAQSD